MLNCIEGVGEFNEVKTYIEEYLRDKNILKKTISYGRIIVFKTGLFKKVKLIYYHSSNSYQLCGDKDILKELQTYLSLKLGRPLYSVKVTREKSKRGVEDRIAELLIERNIVYHKYRYSRETLVFLLAVAVLMLLFIMLNELHDPVIYLSTTLFILICSIVPFRRLFSKIYYVPIQYWRYKRRLEEIDEEIIKLKKLLPKEHRLHEIIEVNLRNK